MTCLSFCPFSFDHCVVCSSSIYGFWLPPLVSSNSSWYRHWTWTWISSVRCRGIYCVQCVMVRDGWSFCWYSNHQKWCLKELSWTQTAWNYMVFYLGKYWYSFCGHSLQTHLYQTWHFYPFAQKSMKRTSIKRNNKLCY